MAFLNVNGVDVSVSYEARPEQGTTTIGEQTRSFTGKMLSSVRAFRSSYNNIATVRLTAANGNTLWNALTVGPLEVYGDMLGTDSSSPELMYVTGKSRTFEQIGTTEYQRIVFSLAEED